MTGADVGPVAAAVGSHPMVPRSFRVKKRSVETHDTVTLALEPLDGRADPFRPGQFNMLYSFGIGEVPVSMSGRYQPGQPILHTVRSVGAVSAALCRARRGDIVGVRGPYGTAWGVEDAEGADVLLVAGGIGLAPLRPALHHILAQRDRYGRVVVLVGGRAPEEVVFWRELQDLSRRADVTVEVTVDRADSSWTGHVGVVTQLLARAPFDPGRVKAMICGPEIMMRFTVDGLLARGVAPGRIRVSLERNMKCAIGWCGHCQLGPVFVCRDGPVWSYEEAAPLMAVKQR